MLALHGFGVGNGIAIGRALVLRQLQPAIDRREIDDVQAEIERFRIAIANTRAELRRARSNIPAQSPGEVAGLVDAHLMMLEDTSIARAPEEVIASEKCNAEWALKIQNDKLGNVFAQMDDAYLRSKKSDVDQVINRIQWQLAGGEESSDADDVEGRILFANDLSPADAVLMKSRRIAAFATNLGGPISHTAILARSLRIPAIVGLHGAARYVNNGERVIVDGSSGIVVIDPDDRLVEEYQNRRLQGWRQLRELSALKDQRTQTRDGQDIALLANIELPKEVGSARKVKAAGVGLFRTEYLFMNRDEAPGEQEQYEAYRHVVESLGRPVTIRTIDIGADKQAAAVTPDAVPTNPALGLRAIRLCLSEPSLFRPQLRAILRASAHGPVDMMIPMVSSLDELDRTLDLIREIKRELRREQLDFDDKIRIGGMIEVPAAAISADIFAGRLDFLSIGTNDLIQYTLAIDRVDDEVNYLYDPLHPAVLRLIKNTIDAGERANIPVSMCGEMAGDATYTRLLLGMNLKLFSMDPLRLLSVKNMIRNSDYAKLREQASSILDLTEPGELHDAVDRLNQ